MSKIMRQLEAEGRAARAAQSASPPPAPAPAAPTEEVVYQPIEPDASEPGWPWPYVQPTAPAVCAHFQPLDQTCLQCGRICTPPVRDDFWTRQR